MRTLAFLSLGLLFSACTVTNTTPAPSGSPGSSSSSGGSSGTTPTLTSAACNERCVAKANACGGVPETAENPNGTQGYCDSLCASALTEEQMTCLEGKSCTQLASSSPTVLCPPPSSSSSSSSSGGSTSPKSKGDACTCDKTGSETTTYKTCIGNTSACFDIKLACLAVTGTGQGTCVVTCSKDNDGEKCPSGGTCGSSGRKAIDGSFWYVCD